MLSVCQDVAKSAIPSGTFSSSKLFYFFLLFHSRLLTFLFHVISAKVLPHIYRCNVLLDGLTLINSSYPSTCVSVGWILFFCNRFDILWPQVEQVMTNRRRRGGGVSCPSCHAGDNRRAAEFNSNSSKLSSNWWKRL